MENISLKKYIWGFALSIVCTLTAYVLTYIHVNSAHETIPHEVLIPAILGIAVIQLVVQLIFFLHLGKGSRLQLVVFISTLALVFLIIGGSLWIMSNLNYNMTPDQMNQYQIDQSSF